MLSKLQAFFQIRALYRKPLYQGVLHQITTVLNDESAGLGKHASQETKTEMAEEALKAVGEIERASDPVRANREKLVSCVIELAKFQVLMLRSAAEEAEDVTGLRGHPGISGELRPYLDELVQKDKDLKEFVWGLDNPTAEDIRDAVTFRYWVLHFWAEVFQKTRIVLKDHHVDMDKDWYRPFVAAMCAWAEHNYRQTLGLPDALAEEGDGLEALRYSTYADIVLSGAKYPNLEWNESYRR